MNLGNTNQLASIPSWNCINGFCVDPGDGSGTYNNLSSCQNSCPQPSLGNIIETSQISCNGGQADIRIDVNGVAGVNAKVVIGFYIGSSFTTWTSPQEQDFMPPNDYLNINGSLHARDWVIRLVDSLTYYDPQGLNVFGQTIIGPAANSGILGDLTGIFYLNSNDGYTHFNGGKRVESVANRMVIFPRETMHSGTTSTTDHRKVINFNWFGSVAEQVDASDLKSADYISRGGSSPPAPM